MEKQKQFKDLQKAIDKAKEYGFFYFIGFNIQYMCFQIWKPPFDETPKQTNFHFYITPKATVCLNKKSRIILDALKHEKQLLFKNQ